MLNRKKTALALLVLGNAVVYAGSMGPVCSAINSTVPCESQAWSVAGKALYLKVSTDTAADFVIKEPAEYNPRLNYNWGFELEAAYHFSTGNDFNLNWYHVYGSNQRSYGASPTHLLGLDYGIASQQGVSGFSKANGQWDAVNMELGQVVNYDTAKQIRFHGGAQFSHIKADINLAHQVIKTNPSGTITVNRTIDSDRTFNGFGPRVGADLSYGWSNGLGIYANVATGILVGTGASKDSYQSYVLAPNPLPVSDFVSQSVTVVAPEFDAKLGLKYTYPMAQGDLTLDAGWMWTDYLSVMSTEAAGQRSDFGLQGVYFGLKWLGNIV